MAVTFHDLLQNMREDADLEDEVRKNKSLNVIRKGLEIRDPGCGDFWEDFMAVCADASGVSELLDVPLVKVSKWASTIKEKIKQVENDKETVADNSSKVISTGNEPLADPNGEEAPQNGTPDTRPMP